VIQTSAGGGGWGSPLQREPERVLTDVGEGYVSAGAAREQYGVVLSADAQRVDAEATAQLRAQMEAQTQGSVDVATADTSMRRD
jgi:N-methylhydantoinase B